MDVKTRTNCVDSWNPDEFFEDQRIAKANKRTRLIRYRVDAVIDRSYTPSCAGTITRCKGRTQGKPSQKSLNTLCFLLNNADVKFETMITATIQSTVHRNNSTEVHKAALKAMLERIRREKESSQYCWVREHQENGSVHWHVFTDAKTECPGRVDKDKTIEWSSWFADYYKKCGKITQGQLRKMRYGNRSDFLGCVRYERLLTDAAGRYAGKEGSKRYQKVAPKKWRNAGCVWWRASRNVACTPIEIVQCSPVHLQGRVIENDEGSEFEVFFKVQRNKGVINESLPVEYVEED